MSYQENTRLRNKTTLTLVIKRRLKLFLAFLFFTMTIGLHAQVPFTKGVNLTNWFQSSNARQIQFSKFTKKDFESIKSLGCDVIRLPINLHGMTSGAPDYTLDPLFLTFLDQAVTWAEELHIHLILDNHTFDPSANTDPAIGSILVKVWTQMATHYKDRSDFIHYEVLNEPHGIDATSWGNIQKSTLDAIRTVDTKHFIIVGAANFNSYNDLQGLPLYTHTKLIYTFHFYDPFIFTHQGASWTTPALTPLAGVPFPYKTPMPAVPATLKGTWIDAAITTQYATEGTVAKVKQLLDVAVNFKNQRNVPVFCGEFGVYIPGSNNADRTSWYTIVRSYLNEKGIPWTIWDYTGGFGLFIKDSNEMFDYDLNIPLVKALAFEVPVQKIYKKRPINKGFMLYDEYIGPGIFEASSTGNGTLNYYSTTTPKAGSYSTYWTGVGQYDAIAFDFKPNLDFSLLPANNFELNFWVKGNSSTAKFDVRFIDTKISSSDHPWRKGKTIDNTVVAWDGQWHQVKIMLKDMIELGSYDGAFFSPSGKFDWSDIDRFEIVPEHQPLTGIEFSFDNIEIAGTEFAIPIEEEEIKPVETITDLPTVPESSRFKVYPNPSLDQTQIDFFVTQPGEIIITVYNQYGQQIKTLLNESMLAGKHTIQWNGTDRHSKNVANGLYVIRLSSRTESQTAKVFLSK